MKYAPYVATQADKADIKSLFRSFTSETGCEAIFDDAHCDRHVQRILDTGIAFLLRKGSEVIGMVLCHRIDAGFAMLEDIETSHTYIVAHERSYVATAALLKAVERHADEQGVAVLFSQCDYRSAVAGDPGNSARVQKLYALRGYRGPIGVVYATPNFIPVGATYLFNGVAASDIAPMQGVCQRLPSPGADEAGDVRDP